ncbi:MAG TPA: class I SAM-dependent methyltransferase [Acidobacteriaceae bacterium]
MLGQIYKRIRKEFAFRDDFDKSRGTETTRHVNRWRTGVGSTAVHYQATGPSDFARACQFLPPEAKTYPFFDLGCGKGRVLIMAHEYGFQRIVGVELSKMLIKTCRRNLSRLGIANASVVEEDAATVAFPDGPVVVFMYNPFRPPVFDAVIERLAKHQYPLFLIYVTPEHRNVIEQTGRFTTIFEDHDLLICQSGTSALPA